MATNYNKLINNLETLKLDKIREYLDTYIGFINEGQKDIVDALYELTDFEVDLRQERAGSLTVGGLRKKKKIDLITSYLSNLHQ